MPGRPNDPFQNTMPANLPNLELLRSYMAAADSVTWGTSEQRAQYLGTVIYFGEELERRGLPKKWLRELCTETVIRNLSREY